MDSSSGHLAVTVGSGRDRNGSHSTIRRGTAQYLPSGSNSITFGMSSPSGERFQPQRSSAQ